MCEFLKCREHVGGDKGERAIRIGSYSLALAGTTTLRRVGRSQTVDPTLLRRGLTPLRAGQVERSASVQRGAAQIIVRHPDLPNSLICATLLLDRERRNRAPSPPYRNPALGCPLGARSGSAFNTRLPSVQESHLRQRRGKKSRLAF